MSSANHCAVFTVEPIVPTSIAALTGTAAAAIVKHIPAAGITDPDVTSLVRAHAIVQIFTPGCILRSTAKARLIAFAEMADTAEAVIRRAIEDRSGTGAISTVTGAEIVVGGTVERYAGATAYTTVAVAVGTIPYASTGSRVALPTVAANFPIVHEILVSQSIAIIVLTITFFSL
jgi:hypothetical protein